MKIKLFSKLVLFFFGLVLFSAPAVTFAQKGPAPQDPTQFYVCLNIDTGDLSRIQNGTTCKEGVSKNDKNSPLYKNYGPLFPSVWPDFCVEKIADTPFWAIRGDHPTRHICELGGGSRFYLLEDLPIETPPIIGTDPTNTDPKPTNTNPKNPPGNTPGRTSPSQVTGDCDPEFVKEGALCVPKREACNGIVCASSAGDLATSVLKIALFIAGIIAVIFSVIGGYQIMTAQGNDSQVTDGRKTLQNSLIGLGIIIASYSLVYLLIETLTNNV